LFFKKKKREKITEKDYHTNILFKEDGNLLVKSFLTTNKPFMISRIGGTEIKCINFYLKYRKDKFFKRPYKKKILVEGAHLSGIYPEKASLFDEFSQIYCDAIKNTDVMAIWYNLNENEICKQFCPDSKLIFLDCLEPFLYEQPWSSELKDKKILVLMPFDETIKAQYQKKELLFTDKNVLSDFELITYKTIQAMGGGNNEFKSWTDAYKKMCSDIQNIDFDVAIIAAGAFGLPLASFIKHIGKQAIHIGGAAQLMFGIKGKRWDQFEKYTKGFYNEHWVYPSQSSMPENTQKINRYEGMAAYWN